MKPSPRFLILSILILTLTSLLFNSCCNDELPEPQPDPCEKLYGSWEWVTGIYSGDSLHHHGQFEFFEDPQPGNTYEIVIVGADAKVMPTYERARIADSLEIHPFWAFTFDDTLDYSIGCDTIHYRDVGASMDVIVRRLNPPFMAISFGEDDSDFTYMTLRKQER